MGSPKLSLTSQHRLLKRCVSRKLKLDDELKVLGLTYDYLRYRSNPPSRNQAAHYVSVSDYDFPKHNVPTVSFFSGAGGLDLGFEVAGFNHIASVELGRVFCDTMRANRPNWKVIGPPNDVGDARNRELVKTRLAAELGTTKHFEGVFHGGPPCQPFSIASNQRFAKWGPRFKRVGFEHTETGTLLFDFVWYVGEFRPKAFMIENVPGIASIDEGEQLAAATRELQSFGYEVAMPALLDACDYGVPQHRQRVFICGWRGKGSFLLPPRSQHHVPCIEALRKPIAGLMNHITRAHRAESVVRYMELECGQRDHLGRVDRLDPRLPSKTVIAGGVRGGGRSHLHPSTPRTLSVRECARLQTFPDDYVFSGAPARQFTQVGNAVPPLLAMKLARALYETVFD